MVTIFVPNTLQKLFKAMLGSLRDLLPIVLVILFFQFAVLHQSLPNVIQLSVGLLFVVLGLTFFIHGLEQGLFPIGESMAHAFARKGGEHYDEAAANAANIRTADFLATHLT